MTDGTQTQIVLNQGSQVAEDDQEECSANVDSIEKVKRALKKFLMTSDPEEEMAPDSSQTDELSMKCVFWSVRDMSSASRNTVTCTMIPRVPSQNVSELLSSVSKGLRYEMNTFALTFQKRNGEDIELTDLPRDTLLSDLGLGSSTHMNLVLLDLKKSCPPQRFEEDDLILGASASPTTSNDFSDECFWTKIPSTFNSRGIQYQSQDADSDDYSGRKEKLGEATSDNEDEISYGSPWYAVTNSENLNNPVSYVGLVNQAMTCYLNSLLQTLYMTPEFRNAVYRWEFKGTEEEALKSIPFQLQKLFLQLQTASKCAVETTNLTRSFGWDSSEVWQQHDIQELYRVMFEALELSFKNTDQANLINNLYEGKMKDYVKCLQCGTESAREDCFLDIPLPIRPFGSTDAYKSVEEALKAFVEPELLTGNDKYECTKCAGRCDAHKGLKFTRFPYLLTLHLKRFDFDYETFHRIKLNDKVVFPNILDLNGFLEEFDRPTEVSSNSSPNHMEVCNCLPAGDSAIPVPPGTDRNSLEKGEDPSTADSGSAPDLEENSSLGCSTSNHTLNDTDTQDEDEGIDVSSGCNEKNRLVALRGPYVYELFSIMIHSGGASGGHYYAYVKDLKTGEWFCFNDQVVSRITDEHIRRTYGGCGGRSFYSSWSSSASAYMLMYRKADRHSNASAFQQADFPPHIKSILEKMVSEQAAEREAREIERNMCKIKLFCYHPDVSELLEKKIRFHKDLTFQQVTELAHKELELSEVVPLDRCRLVRFNDTYESIEMSFGDVADQPVYEVLGGVRSSYKFSLFMEFREEGKKFEEYEPGGVTFRVHVINLSTEEVEGPHTVRVSSKLTVSELKEALAAALSLSADHMRIVRQSNRDLLKLLSCDSKTLLDDYFYMASKIFVEGSGKEPCDFFAGSQFGAVLDRFLHTVAFNVNLPQVTDEILAELGISRYDPLVENTKDSTDVTLSSKDEEKNERNITLSSKVLAHSAEMTAISSEPSDPTASNPPNETDPSLKPSNQADNSSKLLDKPYGALAKKIKVTNASKMTSATDPSSKEICAKSRPPNGAVALDDSIVCTTLTGSLPDVPQPIVPNCIQTIDPNSLQPTGSSIPQSTIPDGHNSVATNVSKSNGTNAGGKTTDPSNPKPSDSNISHPISVIDSKLISANIPLPTGPNVSQAERSVSHLDGHSQEASSNAVSQQGSGLLCSSDEDEGVDMSAASMTVSATTAVNSDQSASEDSSLTSDSDRTLIGEPPEDDFSDHSNDFHNVSSPEETPEDPKAFVYSIGSKLDKFLFASASPSGDEYEERAPPKRYFKAVQTDLNLKVFADHRITIGQLKKELERFVKVPQEHFKLYKYYSDMHQLECSRMNEMLPCPCDHLFTVQLGRALLPGEYDGKVYMLEPESSDGPSRYLIDFVIRKGESVGSVKESILKKVNAKFDATLDPSRYRLRKKIWKNPQIVLLDHQIFEKDVNVYSSWEFYLQCMDNAEPVTDSKELSVFVRQWHPSEFKMGPLKDVTLKLPTSEALRDKLSEVSGINAEDIEFARGKSTFPCDISALDISSGLSWEKHGTDSAQKPLFVLDDGAVIYYRNVKEEMRELSESERIEIETSENVRLNRDAISYVAPTSSSRTKEKGLKIYFNN